MVQSAFGVSQRVLGAAFRLAARALAALALVIGSSMTYGDTWPQRPVKVIVPFGAGGSTDAQARIISERLSVVLGQPVIVENRPGASGAIAAELVARAAPDGYTLFFSALPQISTVPLVQQVHYDPLRDFAPVSMATTNPFVLGVPLAVPARTVGEFVAYVRARPGQLNYATLGPATLTHLAAAQFLARAGLEMVQVPYKDSPQVFAALNGGQVQMFFGTPLDMLQFARAGRVRLLAVSSEDRARGFPDVPALAESYPGFRVGAWNGFLAPAATPRAIVDRLAREVAKIVREPAAAEKLAAIGVDPLGNTPAAFEEFIRGEAPYWRAAIAAAGVGPE